MKTLFCRCSGDPGDDYGGDDFGMALPLEEASARPRVGVRGNVGGYRLSRELLSRMEFGIPVSNVQVRNSLLPQLRISRLFSSYQYRYGVPYVYRYGPYGGYYYYYWIFAVERGLRE